MPVPYHVNVSRLPEADRAAAIAAIRAAFDAYSAVSCSGLRLDYKGTSTAVSPIPNAILVYFEELPGVGAYFYKLDWEQGQPPIRSGSIMMNTSGYGWTVGAAANQIDIQTAVTQMIPGVIGFFVGDDPWSGSLASSIRFNYVQTTLTADQELGVRFIYYRADAGCTTPPRPAACRSVPRIDGVKKDFAVVEGATPPEGKGCCRVSHAGGSGDALQALVGVGLVALLLLRRRRALAPRPTKQLTDGEHADIDLHQRE